MSDVRAFVGHSFTEGDSGIVGAFLTYFDQVSGIYPAFSWQHATASEPVDLRDKVLSLIEGKNTFIGICTRKERVASDELFSRNPLFSRKTWIQKEKLEWKTSDWVIQEIGLAIGRGMAVILLVEDGVRKPGGLQGNIEYLPFKRSSPQLTFGKLLEMIQALSPPGAVGTTVVTELSIPSAIADKAPPQPEHNPITDEIPDSKWTREKYHREFIFRLIRDNPTGAADIVSAYLDSAQSGDDLNKAIWTAETEWYKILLGGGGSLVRLKELAGQFTENSEIRSYLGRALKQYGEPLEAAAVLDEAASISASPSEVVSNLCEAAVSWSEGHRAELAAGALAKARIAAGTESSNRRQILDAICRIAKNQKDQSLHVSALEALVELSPDDANLRFSLAYQHSQIGNDDLALVNYLRILPSERTPLTWNNLGVAFQEFGMPGKAVSAYRKAAAGEETLAMSNLGYKLMESGFFAEASAEFTRALPIEDFHKNIGQGLSNLRAAPDREEEAERDTTATAAEKAAFYRLIGRAIYSDDVKPYGLWSGPKWDLMVETEGDRFSATGEYEVRNYLLQGLPGSVPAVRHLVTFSGRIFGRRIEGSVTRNPADKPKTSLMSSVDSAQDFIMVVDESGTKIEVAESPKSKRPTFYSLLFKP